MLTGDDFFDSDEFLEILSTYETAENSGLPVFLDAEELTDIADYYMTTGNEKGAEKALNKALEIFPGAAAPLAFKAREALGCNDVAKAKLLASQITDKSEREYLFIKAEILIALDKVERADAILKECFETVDEDGREDFVLDIANIYLDYGVYDLSYEWLARSTERLSPDYDELMARTLVGLGKYDEGIDIIDRLIDQNPYSKRHWNALASAQFLAERYDEAVKSSEYALAIDPNDADGLLTKANCLHKTEDFTEALKYYGRYIKSPVADKGLGELNIGMCLVSIGRYDEAVSHLLKALSESGSAPQQLHMIYQELAFAYSAKKCYKEAMGCIDKARKLDNDTTDMDILHGHILLENGHEEEAVQVFRKVIEQTDCDPHTFLRIIVSIYDNKYVDMAYSMLKRLLEYSEEDFNCGYSYMALCCHDLKKDTEFLHYLKLACERNPKEAKSVLGELFPEGMNPTDYYSYFTDLLGHKK